MRKQPFCAIAILAGVNGWLMIAGCAALPANSIATHDPSRWQGAIANYERADVTNPPPRGGIVFVGASYIRKWAPRLAADFPGMQVIDRGFGGCELADVYAYADRIIVPYQPREVVIYAGGNDLAFGLRPAIVYGDFVALARKLQKSLPQVKLVFISLPPSPSRLAETGKFKQVNDLIAAYCEKHGIGFVNTFSLMLRTDGGVRPEIYSEDRLHMNAAGYDLWRDAVKPYLIR